MYPDIPASYSKLLEIYSGDHPNFLLAFLEAPVLKRLADIDQNCGGHYCKFHTYKWKHVRLAHSLGVALIIWNFTHDEKQTLAGLFHDISHSIFSHVGDFLLGDAEHQESSEQYMNKLLSQDPIIVAELKKGGITISDIDDYTIYPIADNHGPQLSADRLEYNLSSALNLGYTTLDDITKIYQNLTILRDEEGIIELGFTDKHIAKQFAELALKNDSECFSNYKNVVSMYFVAEIIRKILERKLISEDQMYTWTDGETIQAIKDSGDSELIEMRRFFENLSECNLYSEKPTSDVFVVSSKSKRRYIDPLVQTPDGCTRVSAVFSDFYEAKEAHIHQSEQWITIDWKI